MEPVTRKRQATEEQNLLFPIEQPAVRQRMATEDMQDLLSQFENKSVQSLLDQLEQNVTSIKTNLEKKKPKVSLADLSAKIDIILEYIGRKD